MGIIYHDKLADSLDSGSVWITISPSTATLSLPFYIMEAGIFLAKKDYRISRSYHSSYLMIYTEKGTGTVRSQGVTTELSPGSCMILDCRSPHEYYCAADRWEFRWAHLNGSGIEPLLSILYPTHVRGISLSNPMDCSRFLEDLFHLAESDDVITSVRVSAKIHEFFAILLSDELTRQQNHKSEGYSQEISAAVEFIKSNYQKPLTIDDMIRNLPISKYHFIRCFRQIMGVTPYSYLTNYRINMAKIMLCTTEASISQIAESCGFQESSNFISHFKKNTGMRPTQYRQFF